MKNPYLKFLKLQDFCIPMSQAMSYDFPVSNIRLVKILQANFHETKVQFSATGEWSW